MYVRGARFRPSYRYSRSQIKIQIQQEKKNNQNKKKKKKTKEHGQKTQRTEQERNVCKNIF